MSYVNRKDGIMKLTANQSRVIKAITARVDGCIYGTFPTHRQISEDSGVKINQISIILTDLACAGALERVCTRTITPGSPRRYTYQLPSQEATDAIKPLPWATIDALIDRECRESYVTPEARAAYRAGLSTAAAICDLVGRDVEGTTALGQQRKAVARMCGDRLMEVRKRIRVREDEP